MCSLPYSTSQLRLGFQVWLEASVLASTALDFEMEASNRCADASNGTVNQGLKCVARKHHFRCKMHMDFDGLHNKWK